MSPCNRRHHALLWSVLTITFGGAFLSFQTCSHLCLCISHSLSASRICLSCPESSTVPLEVMLGPLIVVELESQGACTKNEFYTHTKVSSCQYPIIFFSEREAIDNERMRRARWFFLKKNKNKQWRSRELNHWLYSVTKREERERELEEAPDLGSKEGEGTRGIDQGVARAKWNLSKMLWENSPRKLS